MKKKQIVLYIVVMLVLMTTSVYATINGKLGVKVDTQGALHAGDEFAITISLKDLETDDGIKAVEGYIDIDENVLEDLTVNSIVAENGKVIIDEDNVLTIYEAVDSDTNTDEGIVFNTNPVSGRGDYKIVINLAKPLTTNSDLVTINFKIKPDVSAGDYTNVIVYKTFKVFANEAEERKELDSASVGLRVSENQVVVNNVIDNNTVVNNTSNNVDNNTVNNAANNTVNNVVNNATNNTAKNNTVNNTSNKTTNNVANNAKNNSQNTNKNSQNGAINSRGSAVDNTTSKTNLPKTGYRIILLPIVVMAIVGLVFYKKYSKYNKFNG